MWYNSIATQVNIFHIFVREGVLFAFLKYSKNAHSLFVHLLIDGNKKLTCVAAIGAMRFSCVASAAHFLFI